MRSLKVPVLTAVAVFCTAPVNADLGDQLFKLLANDGAVDDRFGHSVAIEGATAIVGALRDQDNGVHSGSAYLFDTATGKQLFKLLPNDGAAENWFGGSVAISGSTAIVGAVGNDVNGAFSGSASYVPGRTWTCHGSGVPRFSLIANAKVMVLYGFPVEPSPLRLSPLWAST